MLSGILLDNKERRIICRLVWEITVR